MEDQARLSALLHATGVEPRVIEPLARYGDLLLEANRRFNLSGVESAPELLAHLTDSLSIARFIDGPLVDVGSGGGLPAIPLGLVTGYPVTLIESNRKKADFLRSVLSTLGVRGEVVAERAELVGREGAFRERFACATARAVATAPTVLELTAPLLRIGGVAVLQRGQMSPQERHAVVDAAPMLGARLEDEVLLDGHLRVLLVRKVATTGQRFPRRPGVPQKRPLCCSVSRETLTAQGFT